MGFNVELASVFCLPQVMSEGTSQWILFKSDAILLKKSDMPFSILKYTFRFKGVDSSFSYQSKSSNQNLNGYRQYCFSGHISFSYPFVLCNLD